MRIFEWDPADEATTRACHAVAVAAEQVDDPIAPPTPYGWFAADLREGWGRMPSETWVAASEDGTVAGFYKLGLPDLENRDKGWGGPRVHPAARRRGIGRELLRHEGARARAHGRTLLDAEVMTGTAGDEFAQAVGARLDTTEVRRIQYLRDIAPGTVAALRASAERAAAGYSLVTWTGSIPDQYAPAMAEVFNAFNDAPHGENEEPEVWDAGRVRERTGVMERLGLIRSYSVAALAGGTREIAGYTEVAVIPEQPEWGWQELTAVVRKHRGYRLGLLVKTAMLELLATSEPQLRQIETGNAASNQHMIGINEQLGYRVVDPGWSGYEMTVSALL